MDNKDDELPDKDAAKEFYARYEPKEILGRGVSSTVRRCVEKETGMEFAAKIIDLSNDPENRGATLEEINILRMVIGHEYIIHLHDVFESETFIFLVFELCRNGELFDYLTNVVTLSEKKTRYIMRQLFEALQHVHRQGVVHRDIKPENILLDDALDIKLTDFGFASVLKPNQLLRDLCGTPNYLAPEVLKVNMFDDAEGYGFSCDLWACGVVMYTLLIGCPPFWHRKQMIMLRNIMEGKYTFNSPEWQDISEAPKDLIRKLLVLNPNERLTVDEALEHQFFNVKMFDQEIAPLKRTLSLSSSKFNQISKLAKQIKVRPFNARKKFLYAILVVRVMIRLLQLLPCTAGMISVKLVKQDPYRHKILRKLTDAMAFRVYGHWIKKGEGQNRAALFENTHKTELKVIYMSNLSPSL
ncbi:phosphorylase b kinase gamma catalytic chain, skeletal muscle/heart isoform [Acyrthosiphon pisum]|uniref:phosphorylase kinase n=1 Tax=Acyrthosiphon pisum TaxID=7029 RepID=A0A8R2A6L0_ACYPI|nr:phosphorylase b kinase gamma catalytic chain, skeletal muscle/heart isoform [Acyrthosiphon pisum]|eukprot:XP_001947448.1 PREDICTED: phosphorylase b kinase gamma catalytic chain, skeletal muscle/heart isoform [Acyrthosiphon pisum]